MLLTANSQSLVNFFVRFLKGLFRQDLFEVSVGCVFISLRVYQQWFSASGCLAYQGTSGSVWRPRDCHNTGVRWGQLESSG